MIRSGAGSRQNRETNKEERTSCFQTDVLHIINTVVRIMTQGALGWSNDTLLEDFNSPDDGNYRE